MNTQSKPRSLSAAKLLSIKIYTLAREIYSQYPDLEISVRIPDGRIKDMEVWGTIGTPQQCRLFKTRKKNELYKWLKDFQNAQEYIKAKQFSDKLDATLSHKTIINKVSKI